MNGNVARFVDVADFVEQAGRVEIVFEGLLVDESSQGVVVRIIGVGKLEVGIVGIKPVDSLV